MNENAASLEALLFASGDPVPKKRLSLLLQIEEEEVVLLAQQLNEEYENRGHALTVLNLGDCLQLCTKSSYGELVRLILEDRKPPSLSEASLETLAIIAYYQPATSAYVSKIRGVDSSYTIASLCDKGLIRPCGRLDVVGRPVIYETTELFLRTMGLEHLEQLPPLPELEQSDAMEKILSEIEQLTPSGENLVSPVVLEGQMALDEVVAPQEKYQE